MPLERERDDAREQIDQHENGEKDQRTLDVLRSPQLRQSRDPELREPPQNQRKQEQQIDHRRNQRQNNLEQKNVGNRDPAERAVARLCPRCRDVSTPPAACRKSSGSAAGSTRPQFQELPCARWRLRRRESSSRCAGSSASDRYLPQPCRRKIRPCCEARRCATLPPRREPRECSSTNRRRAFRDSGW